MVELVVNGAVHRLDVDPSRPLLYVLRGELGLHAAKFGCGIDRPGEPFLGTGGAGQGGYNDPRRLLPQSYRAPRSAAASSREPRP